MASQPKENWWRNVPKLTNIMDMALPELARLATNAGLENQFKKVFDDFCEFMAEHPLAKQHNKNKRAISDHMKLNLQLYMDGKPLYH